MTTYERRPLSDAVQSLKFLLAGNATITVVSKKTGTRYTFSVKKAKCRVHSGNGRTNLSAMNSCDDCKKADMYFVSLLAGPDNTSDFQYLGIIDSNGFRLTGKSRMNDSSTPVKAFRFTFENLVACNIPEVLEIWHEGRCGRCGRKLTVPSSIESGFGPECQNYI